MSVRVNGAARLAARQFEARAGAVYAIDPRAFFDFFEPMPSEALGNLRLGNVDVIEVEGPLRSRAGGWCDSYESILARVELACAGDAAAIVLRVDSPGGDAAGAFDAARAVRAACVTAGKPLYTFVTDTACSAGYAIAAAATHGIVLSDSALAGSIGVISTRADMTAMNASRGLRVALIVSGSHKADGNPDAPITDDELAATQVVIDSIAEVFFALVEELRGVSAAAAAGYQARVFHGKAAIAAGLADAVGSFDSLLTSIAKGQNYMAAEKSKYEEARSALEEAAKGDDANAAAAKRALAAMDEGKEPADDEASEPDGDEPKTESEPPADDDAPPPKKDDDKDKDKDKDAAASGELSALVEVHKLRAELAAKETKAERTRLLGSRKDLAPELVKALQAAPIALVRNIVATLPKTTPIKPAAAASVPGTRGENQGSPTGSGPAAASDVVDMDRAMGLTRTSLGVRREANSLVFGVRETKVDFAAANGGSAGGAK